MAFEEYQVNGSTTIQTDYGLGARGLDYITKNQNGTITTGFPVYDAHGSPDIAQALIRPALR